MTIAGEAGPAWSATEPDAGFEIASACPALGLVNDRPTHRLVAGPEHRCYAVRVPRVIPPAHQAIFCLCETYLRCPIWQWAQENPPPEPGTFRLRFRAIGAKVSRSWSWPHMTGVAALLLVVAATALGIRATRSVRRGNDAQATATASDAAQSAPTLPDTAATAPAVASTPDAGVTAVPTAPPASPPRSTASSTAVPANPTPVVPPGPRAGDLLDAQLLRPGTRLVSRVNASLDGSAAGNAIVISSVASAAGCERFFLDVYGFDASTGPSGRRFVDVFDASAGAGNAGRLLPPSTKTDAGCLPRPSLVGAADFGGGGSAPSPLAIATVTQADLTVRVVAIGFFAHNDVAAVTFDTTFTAGATVAITGNPPVLEVREPIALPTVQGLPRSPTVTGGMLRSVYTGQGSTLKAATREAVPACLVGTYTGSGVDQSGDRWLQIRCAADERGTEMAFKLTPATTFQPSGVSLASLQPGDELTIAVDSVRGASGAGPVVATDIQRTAPVRSP